MLKSKTVIADSFSRSATRYDQAAKIQQQSGAELLAAMTLWMNDEGFNKEDIQYIADVGCGTGFFTSHLINEYSPQEYIGIDLSQGMLDVAAYNNASLISSKITSSEADISMSTPVNIRWQCDDAENLLLAEQSVDLIYSNFSLQWCENLPQLMKSFDRILSPGGLCCFTTLGSETLSELRDAWSQVDDVNHVNRFYDQAAWQQAIRALGFSILHQSHKQSIMYYPTVKSLLTSLKDIGANVVTGPRHRALMGKQHFTRFMNAYEGFRSSEGYPASYHVHTWLLQKKY